MPRISIALLCCASLSACATLPDVTYSYYLARSITTVTVTQTISCTGDKQQLIIANAPQVTTTYAADYSSGGGPYPLPIKSVDHRFSDTEASVTLSDDGRLKGINSTSTGQGETIIKSAIALAAAIGMSGGSTARAPQKAPPPSALCKAVAKWGNKDGIVTLVYTKVLALEDNPNGKFIVIDSLSNNSDAHNDLASGIPSLAVQTLPETEIVPSAYRTPPSTQTSDYQLITLRTTASMKLNVVATPNKASATAVNISSNIITIPGPHTYMLPIPTAELFGADKFSLTLSDAGAVTAIDYGKTNGTASAFNAATAVTTAAFPAPPPDLEEGSSPPPTLSNYNPPGPQPHS